MNAPSLLCTHCGAHVPPPVEPDAVFATCSHCHFRIPLSVAWVEARQRQQAAIDQRHATAKERDAESRAKRNERLVWTLGIGGFIAAIFLFVLFTVGSSLWEHQEDVEKAQQEQAAREAAAQRGLEQLKPILAQLQQKGCTHEVEPPHAVVGSSKSTLKMNAGGDCLHVVAATSSAVAVTLLSPSGKRSEAQGQGTLDFEHCPAESGEHQLTISTSEQETLAAALLDCPPAFEKHKDDPKKNGFARVQKRLEALQKEGCSRVILAPKSFVGEQSMTATLGPGPLCAVVVAAAGDDSNVLSSSLKTPLGAAAVTPKAAGEVELAYCAKVDGPHALVVTPKTLDYFTLAAMDCPKATALKHGAR